MAILRFKEFDDAERVDTNAVWVFIMSLKFWGIQSIVWLKTVELGVSNFNSNLS